MDTIAPDDNDLRARVQRLAARGVAATVIHVLVGQKQKFEHFAKVYRKELARGAAEADAAVSEALFDLALSGKSPPVTLGWAKQRLGWTVSEDAHSFHAQTSRDENTAHAVATLHALLEQLAACKSGGYHGAAQVAEDGASEPVAARAG